MAAKSLLVPKHWQDRAEKLEAEANRLAIELDLARKDWREAKAEVERLRAQVADLARRLAAKGESNG